MSIQQNKIRAIIEKIWSKVKEPKAMSGDGIVEAIDDVYEAGEKDAIARYWDMVTGNGSRTNMRYLFHQAYLYKELFQYRITLQPTVADCMFYYSIGEVIDFVEMEEKYGFKLDFSNCTNTSTMFQHAFVSRLGVVDLRKTASTNLMFATNVNVQHLVYIEKIISAESIGWSTSFRYLSSLTHCLFEGIVGKSIDLRWSSLDKESLTSLMVCLSDNASGQSCSLLKSAVDKAYETAEGANDGSTSDEWLALVGAKQNWTISLM